MPLYKDVELSQAKNDWHVRYSFLKPGTIQYQRFKERFNMNRIHDLSERLAYGKEAVRFMKEKLESGFNPYHAYRPNSIRNKPLKEVITNVVEHFKNGSPKGRKKDYGTHLNRYLKYLDAAGLGDIDCSTLSQEHADNFKSFLQSKKYAKKTINTSLSQIAFFWDEVMRLKFSSNNYFRSVKRVRVESAENENDEDIFEPLSNDEMNTVFDYFGKHKRNFFIFLALIYYAWGRPVEISRLKVNQFDLTNGVIRFKKADTKNGTAALVQIVPPLLNLLKELNLQQYPGDYYVFSTRAFSPGATYKNTNSAIKWWRKIVIRRLGINKKMYALKHTGNIDYLHRNKGRSDLKWQQMQNRHKTSAMTDLYNRRLGAYFIEVGNLQFREI